MKKLILTLALLSTSAVANNVECNVREAFAHQIMQAKHQGMRLKRVIEVVNLEEYNPLIIRAYKLPNWQAKSSQDRAASEFANKVYLECLEGKL